MTVHVLPHSLSSQTGKATARGRGQARAIILDVVDRLLCERGAETLSMELVAQEAGIVRRTVYNHFGSTGELFRISRKRLLAAIAPLAPNEVPVDIPPVAALTIFARRAIQLFTDPRQIELMLSIVRDGRSHPWLAAAYDREIQTPMRSALERYFSIARRAGLFDHDPRRASYQLLWTLDAAAMSLSIFQEADASRALDEHGERRVRAFVMQHYGREEAQFFGPGDARRVG
ncbi:TetR/AcrR family transcriptional regulator [Sphingomonas cavernae]|nr:TetR/AcrR family transcriptional regulator [Sphingomonas cavernae]